MEITHDALMMGIEAARPGNTFGDIGAAIQGYAESQRTSVVRDFCGHGLGRVFHAPPNVLHYGRGGTGPVLEEGMFFTIEPMINLGRPETKVYLIGIAPICARCLVSPSGLNPKVLTPAACPALQPAGESSIKIVSLGVVPAIVIAWTSRSGAGFGVKS